MAAESGLMWPPGRSCGALSGRDVAPGTCRAGGLRLGPVGAAWHLPGPTTGLLSSLIFLQAAWALHVAKGIGRQKAM